MKGNTSSNSDQSNNGDRSVIQGCGMQKARSFDELMNTEWAEFVIRYDTEARRFVTGTACCVGAPVR